MLSARRFPLTAEYLAALPKGVDGYPHCRVRADHHEDLPGVLRALAGEKDLPEPVRQYIAAGAVGDWVDETVATTCLHLVRDVVHTSAAAFYAWDEPRNLRSFERPLYRVLMAVLSPTLLVMGATKRWSSFHQGTTLEPRGVEKLAGGGKRAGGTLRYPPHLFDRWMVEVMVNAYRVALVKAKAIAPEASVDSWTPEAASFWISWRD